MIILFYFTIKLICFSSFSLIVIKFFFTSLQNIPLFSNYLFVTVRDAPQEKEKGGRSFCSCTFFFGTIWCARIFFFALHECFFSIFLMQDFFQILLPCTNFFCLWPTPPPPLVHFSSGTSLISYLLNFAWNWSTCAKLQAVPSSYFYELTLITEQ